MKALKTISMITLLSSLASCSLMPHRDYENEMADFMHEPMFTPGEDFEMIPGDTGRGFRSTPEIMKRTPATVKYDKETMYRASIQDELSYLENRLSDLEYERYQRIRNKLNSDSERIYYLRLGSKYERRVYLENKGIAQTKIYTISDYKMASYGNDLVVGMDQSSVTDSLGQPDRVMTTGDVYSRQENWVYHTASGTKVVYFRGGRVAGWQAE
jgi:hypothetical protein